MNLGPPFVAADPHMARASALKNMLLGAASVMSALDFVLFGPVDWRAIVPLGTEQLVGSVIEPQRPGAFQAESSAGSRRSWGLGLGLGLTAWLWLMPS